ncbi:MAG: hypothetical protein ACE5KX_09105, partial [Acidimicrobiia bacterium]
DVIRGPGAGLRQPPGLRGRTTYGLVAGVLLSLVGVLIPGATWNYFNPGGYMESIAWIWAVSAAATVLFLAAGATVGLAAPRWIPVIVGLIGLGATIRLALLVPAPWTVVIVIGLPPLTLVSVIATRRLVRRVEGLPYLARPLFLATPLTRSD